MDDLKIYEESQVELESTLEVMDELAGAVGMSMGVRKCARLVRYKQCSRAVPENNRWASRCLPR